MLYNELSCFDDLPNEVNDKLYIRGIPLTRDYIFEIIIFVNQEYMFIVIISWKRNNDYIYE